MFLRDIHRYRLIEDFRSKNILSLPRYIQHLIFVFVRTDTYTYNKIGALIHSLNHSLIHSKCQNVHALIYILSSIFSFIIASSFSISAQNPLIPSASFSVAIASAFKAYRNAFSVLQSFGPWYLPPAVPGLSSRGTSTEEFFNSSRRDGAIVSLSQPARLRISPILRNEAPTRRTIHVKE